jgi:hypothetical protein
MAILVTTSSGYAMEYSNFRIGIFTSAENGTCADANLWSNVATRTKAMLGTTTNQSPREVILRSIFCVKAVNP